MSDPNADFESASIHRRSVLATIGTGVAAGLAGCSGDGGGGGDDGDGADDGSDQTGGTDSDGPAQPQTGGDCPSVPSSFAREDVPAMLEDEPVASVGVPESGATIDRRSRLLRIEYNLGSITVQSELHEDSTPADELSADMTEVTDEYDLPDGARAQREDVASTNRVDVYLPSGSDVVMVSLAASGGGDCLEASLIPIRDELVNTVRVI